MNTLMGRNGLAHRTSGITLIELLIVLVVVSILVGIAYPGYQQFVQRARRSEAQIALTQLAAAQEKLFTRCSTYTQDLNNIASVACNLAYTASAAAKTTNEGNYSISAAGIPDASGTSFVGFTLTAAPVAGKPQANDSKCASIVLASTGQKTALSSGAADTTSECWKK